MEDGSDAPLSAAEIRRRKVLARGKDRLAKITGSVTVPTGTSVIEPATDLSSLRQDSLVAPSVGQSNLLPGEAAACTPGGALARNSEQHISSSLTDGGRRSYGTVAAQQQWENMPGQPTGQLAQLRTAVSAQFPADEPVATSPSAVPSPSVMASYSSRAAVEVLQPLQLMISIFFAAMVVFRCSSTGIAGNLAAERFRALGIPQWLLSVGQFSDSMLFARPLPQLMLLQCLVLASGVLLLHQAPTMLRGKVKAMQQQDASGQQGLMRLATAFLPQLQQMVGVWRLALALTARLTDAVAIYLVAFVLLQRLLDWLLSQ